MEYININHHIPRFFPSNTNALAGTVVAQGINHQTEGDFDLLRHEGFQGISRPCHNFGH